MFLNLLNENEKIAFLNLCIHASKANGKIEIEERNIINEYCKEMGIVLYDADNIIEMPEIVDVFNQSSSEVKKIVVLEILGLLYADGDYELSEKEFINAFCIEINVSEKCLELETELITEYLELIKSMGNLIGSDI